MTTTPVIKHFDEFEQVRCVIAVRPVARGMDSFVFSRFEKLGVMFLAFINFALIVDALR